MTSVILDYRNAPPLFDIGAVWTILWRRRLLVVKYRGQSFRGGYHDYKIGRGGLQVFPRLVAAEHLNDTALTKLPSGLEALDALLGGGLEKGTSTLFIGGI